MPKNFFDRSSPYIDENGDEYKKLNFNISCKKHVDLILRLRYDELRQAEFFRAIVDAYLNKNKNFMIFLEDLKDMVKEKKKYVYRKNELSETSREKIRKEYEEERSTIRKFGLNKEDIENIFDILEKDYSDF